MLRYIVTERGKKLWMVYMAMGGGTTAIQFPRVRVCDERLCWYV
jgi:hypothetical protein